MRDTFTHEATATHPDGLVDVWVIIGGRQYKYTLRSSFTYRCFLKMYFNKAYGRALNILKGAAMEVAR